MHKQKKKQKVHWRRTPIKVPCLPKAAKEKSAWGLPIVTWAGLRAFRPDVISVHLLVELSAPHVFS